MPSAILNGAVANARVPVGISILTIESSQLVTDITLVGGTGFSFDELGDYSIIFTLYPVGVQIDVPYTIQLYNASDDVVVESIRRIAPGTQDVPAPLVFVFGLTVADVADVYQFRIVIETSETVAQFTNAANIQGPGFRAVIQSFGGAAVGCATLAAAGTVQMATEAQSVTPAEFPADTPTAGSTGCPLTVSPRNLLFRRTSGATPALYSVTADDNAIAVGARGAYAVEIMSMRVAGTNIASGSNAIMIGQRGIAGGTYGIALGRVASAAGYASVAVGFFATGGAAGQGVAIGHSATAGGLRAVAIGRNSSAPGTHGTALGHETYVSGSYGSAVGHFAESTGARSVALGYRSQSSGINAVAVGRSNFGNNATAVALGICNNIATPGNIDFGTGVIVNDPQTANATIGINSTAVGIGNLSQGLRAVTLGMRCVASGAEAVAVGRSASALSAYAIAIGVNTTANGSGCVCIGQTAGSAAYTMQYGVFIGRGNTTTGAFNSQVTIGANLSNNASNQTMIGYGTIGVGTNGVSVGRSNGGRVGAGAAIVSVVQFGIMNNVTTPGNIANGTGVISGDPQTGANAGINSVALGIANITSGLRSVSLGFKNTASATEAVAVGALSSASVGYAVAVGSQATASGLFGVAVGQGAVAGSGSSDCIAIGRTATANNTSAIAIGHGALASATYSTAIGDLAAARVSRVTVMHGPQMARRDDLAPSNADKFYRYNGARVFVMTEEFDVLNTGDIQIALPATLRFWVKSVTVIVTSLTGAIVTQPTVRFGTAAAPASILAAVLTTNLTALGQAQDYASLIPGTGQTSADNLSAGVTVAAAGPTTFNCRFLFEGHLVENE